MLPFQRARSATSSGDRGASGVEYGLIVGGVVLVAFGGIIALRNGLTAYFNRQSANVANTTVGFGGRDIPGQPTGLNAVGGNGSATVSWTPVPGASGYTITCGATVVPVTSPSYTCTGLSNGTSYTIVVVATSSGASSAPSTTSVTPHIPPPTNVQTTATTATSATVSWSPVSGATGYVVTCPTGSPVTVTTTSYTCTGLSPGGSYTITVAAKDTNDQSSAVGTTASTPTTVPGAVTGVGGTPTLVAGPPATTNVTVDFNAPASDGGSPITGYTVTSTPPGATCTVDVANTKATCTGLSAGTSYTFSVVAKNANGNSTATASSAVVAPYLYTTPGTKNGSVTQTFTPPAGYSFSGGTCTRSPNSGACSVTGVTAPYTLRATAPNASGTFVVTYTFKKNGSPDVTTYYVITVP